MIKNITVLNDILKNRVPSAYLFVGNEKECLNEALACAAELNCKNKILQGKACGTCAVCKRIEEFNHPDITILRASGKANYIKIKDIKDIQEVVQYRPVEATKRLCIVVGADKFDIEAANSFLKTLEEPPADSFFILITPSLKSVMDTIASRCRRVFINVDGIDISKFCENEFVFKIRNTLIDNVVCAEKWNTTTLEFIDEINEQNKNNDSGSKQTIELMLDIIETAVRDLIVLKGNVFDENLVYNKDKIMAMQKVAGRYSFESLFGLIDKIMDFKSKLDFNLNFKIICADILLDLDFCKDSRSGAFIV